MPINAVLMPTVIDGVETDVPAIVIGSQTIVQGQNFITNGFAVSVGQVDGQRIAVLGGSSFALNSGANPGQDRQQRVGDLSVGADSDGNVVIAGQTLAAGQPITIGSGDAQTVVSIATDASGQTFLVVGGASAVPGNGNAGPITVGGQVVTQDPAGNFVISGETLSLGGAVTTLGSDGKPTTISLSTDNSGNTVLVVGDNTATLGGTESTIPLGNFIMSGLGGLHTSSKSSAKSGSMSQTDSVSATRSPKGPTSASTRTSGAQRFGDVSKFWVVSLLSLATVALLMI